MLFCSLKRFLVPPSTLHSLHFYVKNLQRGVWKLSQICKLELDFNLVPPPRNSSDTTRSTTVYSDMYIPQHVHLYGLRKNAVNISYSVPLCEAFLHRHNMEIVATTIRVHEYTVRRAQASPKHCSAENKHRFCFLPLWQAFQIAENHTEKMQHFLGFLVSSALQNNVFIPMGSTVGSSILSEGTFFNI